MREILSTEHSSEVDKEDVWAETISYGLMETTIDVHEGHGHEEKRGGSIPILYMDESRAGIDCVLD